MYANHKCFLLTRQLYAGKYFLWSYRILTFENKA
jgi:hypothetical protein